VQVAVVDRYEDARRAVEERIDTARSAIEIKKRQASEAVRAGRQAAHDARDELERRIAEGKAAYRAGADVVRTSRAPGVPDEGAEGGGTPPVAGA
jgi:hypothetical protein